MALDSETSIHIFMFLACSCLLSFGLTLLEKQGRTRLPTRVGSCSEEMVVLLLVNLHLDAPCSFLQLYLFWHEPYPKVPMRLPLAVLAKATFTPLAGCGAQHASQWRSSCTTDGRLCHSDLALEANPLVAKWMTVRRCANVLTGRRDQRLDRRVGRGRGQACMPVGEAIHFWVSLRGLNRSGTSKRFYSLVNQR